MQYPYRLALATINRAFLRRDGLMIATRMVVELGFARKRPGAVWTPSNLADESTAPMAGFLMADHCPLGRCAEAEDVARVVAFLASADGGWVNGEVITISGGSSQ
jgi:NAD(P)-dependent dehydrogenase (short-subunit alcohol dehydrogenase family)